MKRLLTLCSLLLSALCPMLYAQNLGPVYEKASGGISVTGIDAASLGDGSVSTTEFQYINTLTSNVQTQINALSPSDHLSVLTAAEISITSATTATISRQHIISGTSSNYTVTLPAASGNTGKFIGLRISPSATKLFTIDGNASETIDGSLTRIMWSGESATLYCDGSNWFKIAGKSKPTQCKIYYTSASAASIADATVVATPFSSTTIDNTGLMADLTNDRVNVIRPGQYVINAQITYSGAANASTGVTANSLNTQTRINKNGSLIANTASYVASGATSYPAILSVTVDVAANSTDYYTTHAYQTSGATQYFFTGENLLEVTEIPSW